MPQTILVTGGAGYIGSHTALELLKQNYQVVVLDNFERGYQEALTRIQKLANTKLTTCQADLRQPADLAKVFQDHPIDAVIHFAAYKDVGEADKDPQKFYQNNLIGTYNLLQAMRDHQVSKIIFSSTSAVYGESKILPMHEGLPLNPKNAYGHTKAAIEWMLSDYNNSYQIDSVSLRYFNAAGADPSGKIGEDPSRCGNIIPLLMQTLVGQRPQFNLYGDKHPTKDGTQERDYIHVSDLATGHLAALKKLDQSHGAFVYNLGTGQATSNQQLINLAQEVSGKQLSYQIVEPRPGDPPVTLSDPQKAISELNWKPQYSVEQIVQHQWNWVSQNPKGYSK